MEQYGDGLFLTLSNVSAADWLQMVSITSALAIFFYQQNKSVQAQRVEIYQRLEIESSNVFRFEAEHSSAIRPYKTQIKPATLTDEDITASKHIARKYYETTCNMFEVACRLRYRKIMPEEVFGSWVAWYFDTLTEWGFRAAWGDLRDNYIKELRTIFDPFMDELVGRWDQSAQQAEPSDEELKELRRRFYRHLGTLYRCRLILNWLEESERSAPALNHPHAYA
jgi:hypothetical protein